MSGFEALYGAVAPRVYGYLRVKLGNSEEADDVFQRFFAKLHKSRAQYDSKYDVMPWVFAICRSVLIDHARELARHRQGRDDVDPDTLAAARVEDSGVSSRALDPALMATLSERERVALQARYVEELDFSEIAKRISVSEANVRQIISRAVRRLRRKNP